MDLNDQIKTSKGALPTKAAFVDADSKGDGPSAIRFELFSPEELAACPELERPEGEPCLEDIGLLLKAGEHGPEIRVADIQDMATRTGPLFGRSSRESIEAWQCVIMLAHDAVMLQEVVNGGKPLFFAQERVVKTAIDNVQTGNSFVIYAVSFLIGSEDSREYERFLPELPWFKKFASERMYDYAFMQCDRVDGGSLLSAFLISFASEITTLDFAAVLEYLKNDISLDQKAIERLSKETGLDGSELAAEATYGLVAAPGALRARSEVVVDDDLPHVQKLVQALISLHLQGIIIDIFRSNETDDFMVFENCLSSLWYGFAMKLGQVKIGYCEQCGKGFSLSGHRGIRRRFCSDACKTKAKNARAKTQRDEARTRFKRGEPVREIARSCYTKEDEQQALKHIRASLRTWKELQRDLDVAIVYRKEGRDFLARCLEEEVFTQDEILARARMLNESPRLMKKAQERHAGQGKTP